MKKRFDWFRRNILTRFSKKRRIQKTISFRIFATAGTFTVAFILTGNPIGSVTIAGAQALTNSLIYNEHEKLWDGKDKPTKNDLRLIKQEIEQQELTPEQKEHLRKHGDFINE